MLKEVHELFVWERSSFLFSTHLGGIARALCVLTACFLRACWLARLAESRRTWYWWELWSWFPWARVSCARYSLSSGWLAKRSLRACWIPTVESDQGGGGVCERDIIAYLWQRYSSYDGGSPDCNHKNTPCKWDFIR